MKIPHFLYPRLASWLGGLLITSILLAGCQTKIVPTATSTATTVHLAPQNTLIAPTALPIPTNPIPTASAIDPWVEMTLAQMTPEEKVGQLLITGVTSNTLLTETCSLIQSIKPGGVFYQDGNVIDPEHLRSFSASLQDCASAGHSLPLLVSMDHEGQYINRFLSGASEFPAALAIGASGDPDLAYQAALASGSELRYSGVNLVLGPVADILFNPDNRLMAVRTYGDDPQQAQNFVAQAISGYSQAGLIATLKHFPGHGGADARYALRSLPVDQTDLATLKARYLPSFAAGIRSGANIVMLGHIAFPKIIGSNLPASLSPLMVGLLRTDLQFNGVIMSDAIMQREGITDDLRDVPASALQSFQAGVDLILLPEPEQVPGAYQRLLQEVKSGVITSERLDTSVRRILTLKAAWKLKAFPVAQPAAPDWAADARLAQSIGARAVTVIRNSAGLVPIPAAVKRMLVIAPQADWRFYQTLATSLKSRGIQADFVYYSSPWQDVIQERDYVQTLPQKAVQYDLTLYFTWQAHINGLGKDAWQGRLGKRLARGDLNVIIVALRSPTDILDFPKADTYLATFGTTEGELQGLLDILMGKAPAVGQIPWPNRFANPITIKIKKPTGK